jgi:hypothetical protein
VFRLRPVRFALAGDALVPEPSDWEVVAVKVESVLDVPHSNHAVVRTPFGLTVPFIVAEFDVTELADVEVTVGGFALVVKLRMASFCVPPLFWAATR